MKFQTGKQRITVQILSNITRSKGNHAMKIGHLIEYNVRKISLQTYFSRKPVADLILILKKAFYEIKASGHF